MDERKIKRLLAMLVMAIVVIMFFKYLLTRAVTNLGNAAMVKKNSAVVLQVPAPASDTTVVDTPDISAISAVEDSGAATSSVESTAY